MKAPVQKKMNFHYEGLRKSQAEWARMATGQVMGDQATHKKLCRKAVYNEIRFALSYGVHVAALDMLIEHQKDPMSIDVMVGELQLMCASAHDSLRLRGNLRIPKFDIDACLANGYEVNLTSSKNTSELKEKETDLLITERNFYVINKDDKKRIAPFLTHDEFKCKCSDKNCHFTLVDSQLIQSWHKLRKKWDKPLKVNSGFRCQSHNESVGGTSKSFHTKGSAIDIDTNSMNNSDKLEFISLARDFFKTVLEYESFIHCHNE